MTETGATIQPQHSISVRQQFRGVAVYGAFTALGALMIVTGFAAGMRASLFALLLFLTGCLLVVATIMKFAIAIGDRKPVLVLTPRELIDARRPAYDQALRWSDIERLRIVKTAADGAAAVCEATLELSPGAASESREWRIRLDGLDISAAELIELLEANIQPQAGSSVPPGAEITG